MLRSKIAHLKPYALTVKNIFRLFCSSPQIITENEKVIDAKIEYFRDVMRAEVSDVVKSSAFAHPLVMIKQRHVFLDRLGLYKPRSPKADPLEPSKNPRMHQIMDTTDKAFATKICNVTLDEFEAFQALYKKEMDRKRGPKDD